MDWARKQQREAEAGTDEARLRAHKWVAWEGTDRFGLALDEQELAALEAHALGRTLEEIDELP